MKKCLRCESELILLHNEIYECTNCDYLIKKNTYENKLYQLNENSLENMLRGSSLWYRKNIQFHPNMIAQEYDVLYNMAKEGNVYGSFLKLRDLLEILIKFPVLIAISNIIYTKEKDINHFMVLEFMLGKTLNLGDWREIANFIYKNKMSDDVHINNILKGIRKIYFDEKIDIVKWRNDNIGHSATKYSNDDKFQKEIFDRLKVIHEHFEKCDKDYIKLDIYFKSKANKMLLNGTSININNEEEGQLFLDSQEGLRKIYPSIYVDKGEIYFFDTHIDKKLKVSVLNYKNGHKTDLVESELSYLYHNLYMQSSLAIKKSKMINKLLSSNCSNDEELLLGYEREFNEYQGIIDYTSTNYIESWLEERIKAQDSGKILLQMERGMGKTTFVRMLEKGLLNDFTIYNNVVIKTFYINELFTNNIEYFNDNIYDLLRTDEDGKNIFNDYKLKITIKNLNDKKVIFMKIIEYFSNLYKRHYNKENIILFIDGIDELNESDSGKLLEILPTEEEICKGVHIVITCRTDEEIQIGLIENIRKLNIKVNNKFLSKKMSSNNIMLLKRNIKYKFEIYNEELIDIIIQKSNYKFLYLNILKSLYLSGYNIFKVSNEKEIIIKYLDQIRLIVGEKHFENIKKILLIIILSNEPITIREIEFLFAEKSLINNLLIYLYEIKGLLKIDRSFRGNLLSLSNIELKNQIVEEYKEDLIIISNEWINRVIELIDEDDIEYNELETLLVSNISLVSSIIKEIDLNKFDLDLIIKLQKYIVLIEHNKNLKYIAKRYYNINNLILSLQTLLYSNKKLKDKHNIIDIMSAETLSKSADGLFENIEEDYKVSVKKYELAIEKRLGILEKLFDLDMEDLINGVKITKCLSPTIFQLINLTSEDYINICRVYYRFGEIDKAEENCLIGIKIYENYLNNEDKYSLSRYFLAKLELARIYQHDQEYSKSTKYSQESEAICLDLINDNYEVEEMNLMLCRIYECLGSAYYYKGDYSIATKYYCKAIEIIENLQVDKIATLNFSSVLYSKLGTVYLVRKEFNIALKYFNKQVDIYKKLDCEDMFYEKMEYIRVYKNLGVVKLDTGFYEESITDFEIALKELEKGCHMIRKGTHIDHEFRFIIYLNMADSLFLNKDYKNSSIYFSMWLKLVEDDKVMIACSAKDVKVTLKRMNYALKQIGDNSQSKKVENQLKRLDEVMTEEELSKKNLSYIIYGYEKYNLILDKRITENNVEKKDVFYKFDLSNNKIISCINNIDPIMVRYSNQKKTFSIKFDDIECNRCKVIKCPHKLSTDFIKTSLKSLKNNSIIEYK